MLIPYEFYESFTYKLYVCILDEKIHFERVVPATRALEYLKSMREAGYSGRVAVELTPTATKAIPDPDHQDCEVVILNTCVSSLGDPSQILEPLIEESQILKSGFCSVKTMHSSWSLYWLC